jgi:hypothetical protein
MEPCAIHDPQVRVRADGCSTGQPSASPHAVWALGRLGSIDAAKADRHLPAAVTHPQGVPVPDGDHRGGLAGEGQQQE